MVHCWVLGPLRAATSVNPATPALRPDERPRLIVSPTGTGPGLADRDADRHHLHEADHVGGVDQLDDDRGEQPLDGDAVPHDPGPTAAADIGTENPLGTVGGFRKTPSGNCD